MLTEPLFILAVLGAAIALSEWLVRSTVLRHLGTAMLVILITGVVANLGLIPTGSDPPPLYDVIFARVAPLSIILLLMRVRLGDLRQAGGPMLVLFGLGMVGTMAGVVVGMWSVDGEAAFGDLHAALGGMFAATYTGGSLNFNIIAQEYGVQEEGVLYTGAVAVDVIMTAVWIMVCIAVPRGLQALRSKPEAIATAEAQATADVRAATDDEQDTEQDTETVRLHELALLLTCACAILWGAEHAQAALRAAGLSLPGAILYTTFALILAQIPAMRRLRGGHVLGLTGLYLFLAVIGAYSDLAALAEIGSLGVTLFVFVTVLVSVHGLVVFGGAALLKLDRDVAAVASQANIGGGTSALAIARSLGRADLVLPGILVGSLGTASGTYVGFFIARMLGG